MSFNVFVLVIALSGPKDFWSAANDQEGRARGASPPPWISEPVQPGASHESGRGGTLVAAPREYYRHLRGGGKESRKKFWGEKKRKNFLQVTKGYFVVITEWWQSDRLPEFLHSALYHYESSCAPQSKSGILLLQCAHHHHPARPDVRCPHLGQIGACSIFKNMFSEMFTCRNLIIFPVSLFRKGLTSLMHWI